MLLFRRRKPLDDFLEAIGPELRAIPGPDVTTALRDRIIASRASGVRVMLPHNEPPGMRRSWSVVSVGLIAAALLVFLPFAVRQSSADSAGSRDGGQGFLGTLAYAQGARAGNRPVLDPVRLSMPPIVRPLSADFTRRITDDTGRMVDSSTVALTIAPVTDANASVLRITSRDQDIGSKSHKVAVESVYVARADLGLLRRAIHVMPYSRFQRINVWQRFAGDSISGLMNTDGPGIGAGRRIARVLPRANAPYITESTAPFFLMGAKLASTWRGSASSLGWAVRDDDVFIPIELRVEGEEKVNVPAGLFDCWRLSIRFGSKQVDYWARKSDGLGVRVLDRHEENNRTRELLLVRQR